MLHIINESFPMKEKDIGEFSSMKVSIMKFKVRSFDVAGLGHVSVMAAAGLLGLMKMETLVINPFEKDAPLFSYDRVHAMGNETILLELYDTLMNAERKPFSDAAEMALIPFKDIPDETFPESWDAEILMSGSVKKKGKKKISGRFDQLETEYLKSYIQMVQTSPSCKSDEKKKAAAVYSEGLLKNGGVSTSVFLKAKGQEFTEKFFREALFGTGSPD